MLLLLLLLLLLLWSLIPKRYDVTVIVSVMYGLVTLRCWCFIFLLLLLSVFLGGLCLVDVLDFVSFHGSPILSKLLFVYLFQVVILCPTDLVSVG